VLTKELEISAMIEHIFAGNLKSILWHLVFIFNQWAKDKHASFWMTPGPWLPKVFSQPDALMLVQAKQDAWHKQKLVLHMGVWPIPSAPLHQFLSSTALQACN
jgi:predicted neuraminidase